MEVYKVRIEFINELLGTANSDPNVHEEFIASKAPNAPSREEEVAALGVETVAKKEQTIFSRDEDGNPILWNYQIRGFFKSAAKATNLMIPEEKITAYKSKIDNNIFVYPRQLVLHMPEGSENGNCQRSLRAQTQQGERIALANSESCPPGTWCEFEIVNKAESEIDAQTILNWLYQGRDNGIGQWRNSGKGAFKSRMLSARRVEPSEYAAEREENYDANLAVIAGMSKKAKKPGRKKKDESETPAAE